MKNGSKKLGLVIIGIVLVISLVTFAFFGEDESKLDVEPLENVKEFTMTAKQFEFDPDTIVVNEGDVVILNVKSVDVRHAISIPAFDVNEQIFPGDETTIEFVADKKGTFSFYCSAYCGVGHANMDGKIIVE